MIQLSEEKHLIQSLAVLELYEVFSVGKHE